MRKIRQVIIIAKRLSSKNSIFNLDHISQTWHRICIRIKFSTEMRKLPIFKYRELQVCLVSDKKIKSLLNFIKEISFMLIEPLWKNIREIPSIFFSDLLGKNTEKFALNSIWVHFKKKSPRIFFLTSLTKIKWNSL